MFILLLSFVLLICVGEFILKNSRSSKLLKSIPEPPRIPLIGHGLYCNYTPTELFYMIRSFSNTFKSIFKVGIGHMQIVHILDPEDIEVILNNPYSSDKSLVYEFMRPWVNDGLLLSTGNKWKCRRRLLGTAFYYNNLREYLSVFNESSEKLILKLKSLPEDTEIDVMEVVVDCTLHNICRNAMGVNLDKIGEKQKSIYKNSVKEMGKCLIYRAIRFWLHPDFIFGLFNVGKKQKKAINELHNFATEVINQKREVKENDITENYERQDSKQIMTLLDLLLAAEKEGKINEEGVKEEVDSFIFGGHDTTTSSMTFCLMLLANNPEQQELLYREIIEEFSDHTEELTMAKFNNLSYLERCIKETLRLYPSVAMLGRILKKDVQLPKYTLPAGTTVQILTYDLHRKASIYMNPDKFDPDRFLPENCKNRHPYAYLPFSAGSRNCIGQKYSMLEQKVLISSIIKNFKLIAVTKPDDLILEVGIILMPVYPIKIKLIPRS